MLKSVEGPVDQACGMLAGLLTGTHAVLGKRNEASRWLTEVRDNRRSCILYPHRGEDDSLRRDERFAASIGGLDLPEDLSQRPEPDGRKPESRQ